MGETKKAKPPKHLSAASKRLWREIQESCAIDAAAGPVLVTMLEALDRRQMAGKEIKLTGAVLKDRFGMLKPNPWVAVERDATLIMQRSFRLLGFDQEPRGGANQTRFSFL
jgi:phage terminase small subunit